MATVAEVTLDEQRGAIRLPNVWMAVDLGIAVQPRNVVGQIEGAVIYGASNALYERITIRHGHVEQSNFHDYAVARMADAPETHVKLIGTDRPPTGIGDRAVLGVAPVIANAFAALTGRRLRHMPFNRQRVREALATRS
jgi:isoquinoline 1-oxidoreductase beta subunit